MAHRGYTADPNSDARRSPAKYGDLHVTPTERGYSTDPNAEVLADVEVKSRRPINRWVYRQDFTIVPQTLPAEGDIGELFGKEFSHKCSVTSGTVDHIFAAVKTVEAGESIDLDRVELEVGDLAIDSDGLPALQSFVVDPSTLDVWDGWLVQDPQVRPYNWDGGLFSQWNQGVNIDGLTFRITDGNTRQELEVYRFVVFEDGSLIELNGEYPPDTFLEVTRAENYNDDSGLGNVLGRINYEVVECVAVITDWSHYNWDDDEPIRKAFKALIHNLPDTVTNIYVPVIEEGNSQLKTSPDTAMWISLGFVRKSKTDQMLIYSFDDNIISY